MAASLKNLRKIIAILLTSTIISIVCYCFMLDLYWYDHFFQHLYQNDIHSYRLFNIWVKGDQVDAKKLNPIGGNQDKFNLWKQAVERFLERSLRYQKIKFLFEIILDKQSFALHQDLFNQWDKKYPGLVRVTLLEHLVTEDVLVEPLYQCTAGIPSICSDFLRSWHHNNPDYAINVYMDIDTLSVAYKNRLFYTSKDAFGIHDIEKGLYNTYHNSGNSMHWNGDFLIDIKNHADWDYIKATLLEDFTSYQQAFIDMRNRSQRLKLETFSDYLSDLKRRTLWWQEHSNLDFNQNSIICKVIGPGFWLRMLFRNISTPYQYANKDLLVGNYFSWMDDGSVTSGESYTVDQLKFFLDQDAVDDFLKITLMTYDYLYFKARGVQWLAEHEQYLIELLNRVLINNEQLSAYPHFKALAVKLNR